jgi:hypothetical protein
MGDTQYILISLSYSLKKEGVRECVNLQDNHMENIIINLKRYPEQENGAVFRWYEDDNVICSLVEGYFPDECNFRFTFWNDLKDIDSFEVRGSKSIVLEWDDEMMLHKVKVMVENHINWEKQK